MCIDCILANDWKAHRPPSLSVMEVAEGVRVLDSAISEVGTNGARRLIADVFKQDAVAKMPPKELTDAVWEALEREAISMDFMQLIHELMTRVYPEWINEEPS